MDAINLKHKSLAKVGQKSNKYMRKNYGALNSSKYGKYLPNTRKGNTN